VTPSTKLNFLYSPEVIAPSYSIPTLITLYFLVAFKSIEHLLVSTTQVMSTLPQPLFATAIFAVYIVLLNRVIDLPSVNLID
jgi:hypothetical protein